MPVSIRPCTRCRIKPRMTPAWRPERRTGLCRDGGGEAEQTAVCYLQLLLSDALPRVGRGRLMRDVDAAGTASVAARRARGSRTKPTMGASGCGARV